jgi:hypothetical protein
MYVCSIFTVRYDKRVRKPRVYYVYNVVHNELTKKANFYRILETSLHSFKWQYRIYLLSKLKKRHYIE